MLKVETLRHLGTTDAIELSNFPTLGNIGTEALRMMKVAKELPNSVMSQNIGVNALYLITTLPDEEKQV